MIVMIQHSSVNTSVGWFIHQTLLNIWWQMKYVKHNPVILLPSYSRKETSIDFNLCAPQYHFINSFCMVSVLNMRKLLNYWRILGHFYSTLHCFLIKWSWLLVYSPVLCFIWLLLQSILCTMVAIFQWFTDKTMLLLHSAQMKLLRV